MIRTDARLYVTYPAPALPSTLEQRLALARLDAARIHARRWMESKGIQQLAALPAPVKPLPDPPF